MLKQLLLVVAVLQGCLMAFANSAFAESACPDWASPDAPIMERSFTYISSRTGEPRGVGPRFDAMAHYWMMGTWFRLPYGYINPWPHVEAGEKMLDRQAYIEQLADRSFATGFDPETQSYNANLVTKGSVRGKFAFWYPSLRYVERDLMMLPSQRPCEAGRKMPSSNAFVVMFRLLWPFSPESGLSPPARTFRLKQENLSRGEPLPFFGMKSEEHAYYEPISGYKDYVIYQDNRDLSVNLLCSAFYGEEASVNPLCKGEVWHKPSDLIFFIIFPSEEGQLGREAKWMGPVKAAIDLVQQWHAAAQADR